MLANFPQRPKDSDIFEAYRGVVERAAGGAHDVGGSFDDEVGAASLLMRSTRRAAS